MKAISDDILKTWSKFAKTYDPIKCASIDGTDIEPHDRAVVRALYSKYNPNRFVKGRPECTIFVSRLNHETSKDTIKDIFSKYGKLKRFRMVKDIVTGMPKGYAFVEYEEERAAEDAYRLANKLVVDGHIIFVDFECERLLKGWKPRRLGGGFGGKKESGQLRFGGRDRPFKKPIALELREQDDRRRREKERRVHEDERRRRDKRRSPMRENGVAPKNNKKRQSRDRDKRPLSPRSGSPPRKVARRLSPPKETDKHISLKKSKVNSPPREETEANSHLRKKDGKHSHSQDSKQPHQNNKSKPCPKENSPKEQTKPKSSAKEHFGQKSLSNEKSSSTRGKSKQVQTSSTPKVKHPTEKHHHSPPRQNGRPQTPPERYKRSPPRNPYRSRSPLEKKAKYSPERDADRRRSPVPKYEKRLPPAREKRRSVSPHHGNVHYKSGARRNENFKGESPQGKQERYHPDRRHSPIQSFSERYVSGRERVPVSPSRIDRYSPVNRDYSPYHGNNGRGDRFSPSRRSPGRRYSPARLEKGFSPENIRSHYEEHSSHQRHNRGDIFIHERKRDPDSVGLYPKERPYSPGRKRDYAEPRAYQEHFEYDNRGNFSSDRGEKEFLASYSELRQYSPSRVDLRQPPPIYEPSRDYRDNVAVSRDFVPSEEINPYRDFHSDVDRYASKPLHVSRYLPISRDNTGEHLRHFSPELKRRYISPKEEISRYESRSSDADRSPRRGATLGGRGGFRRN